jgi:photosystem II stability/assembly factor-like uncharacterized protein
VNFRATVTFLAATWLAITPTLVGQSPADRLTVEGRALVTARADVSRQRRGMGAELDPNTRLEAIRNDYLASVDRSSPACVCSRGGATALGPTNLAGRMLDIVPHPSTDGTIFAASADGGVWKSTDGGVTWGSLTECLSDISVGALAVAPSNPSVLYIGSGEGAGGDQVPGIGFITSTDGGSCWSLPPFVAFTNYFVLSVHPTNENDIFSGTTNGGARSTDGGSTWRSTIPFATYGWVTGVVRHPSRPTTLFAQTWNPATSSPKLLRSRDDGRTWSDFGSGLPEAAPGGFVGKLALAIAPSIPEIMYISAAIQDPGSSQHVSHVYKSVDGGSTWTDLPLGGLNGFLGIQSNYANALVVSPTDPNVVVGGGLFYVRSVDGGLSWQYVMPTPQVHVDCHALRYQNAMLYVANDGGVWSSTDDGASAVGRNSGLTTRQFFTLVSDQSHRNLLLGGTQDAGVTRRPDSGGTTWDDLVAGDGFAAFINPDCPSIGYATLLSGAVYRTFDLEAATPTFSLISPPYAPDEITPLRSVLTADPSNPAILYTASYRVWKTTDGGDSWTPLPAVPGSTASTIYDIAVCPVNPQVLLVNKNSEVYQSTDGGAHWITAGQGLPPFLNAITFDSNQCNIAWAVTWRNPPEGVWRTMDGGESWHAYGAGLTNLPIQTVAVDPVDSRTVFLGTDGGLYNSTDQGATWAQMNYGIPKSSVQAISILDDRTSIRVGTHGRGAWQIPWVASSNHPPIATIFGAASMTLTRGTSVTFSGSVTDVDDGDTVTGHWYFADTWERVPVAGGMSSTTHVFDRVGVFPVALTAIDGSRARASAVVMVTIE